MYRLVVKRTGSSLGGGAHLLEIFGLDAVAREAHAALRVARWRPFRAALLRHSRCVEHGVRRSAGRRGGAGCCSCTRRLLNKEQLVHHDVVHVDPQLEAQLLNEALSLEHREELGDAHAHERRLRLHKQRGQSTIIHREVHCSSNNTVDE